MYPTLSLVKEMIRVRVVVNYLAIVYPLTQKLLAFVDANLTRLNYRLADANLRKDRTLLSEEKNNH
jgi:hypothetical protein